MTNNQELLTVLSRTNFTEGILSTGSDPQSLKDLLAIGSQEREVYLDDMRKCLEEEGVESFLCDDALVTTTPLRLGLAYYKKSTLYKQIEDLVQGTITDPIVKPWSTGPWLPEAFADDLRRSLPVYQADDLYASARVFDTYPPLLRDAICAKTMLEIKIKSERAENVVSKTLGGTMLAVDICLAGLRYLHAENKTYFRGLHYADETIPRLPETSQELATNLIKTNNYTLVKKLTAGL